MRNKERHDRFGLFCRHQEIQIVHDFLSAPIAPGDIDL
jgi:hypothetical protein